MKRFLNIFVVCAVSFSTAQTFAAPIALMGVKKNSDGVTLAMSPGKMKLTVCSDGIVRVLWMDAFARSLKIRKDGRRAEFVKSR